MKIHSSEFENGGTIPDRFSQYASNHSLPLKFVDVPATAQSLVLFMDDPDTSHGRFTHWVAYNIDGRTVSFEENRMPRDAKLGRNDAGEMAYAGPKPPCGEHRYFIHAYALDSKLPMPAGAIRAEVEQAMQGHVIAEAELMGRYAAPEMHVAMD